MNKEKCPGCGKEYKHLNHHLNEHFPEHKPDEWDECPSCEERYQELGKHWHFNSSCRPDITKEQKDILTGVLMGDGNIDIEGKYPRFRVSVIKKDYLNHLKNKLQPFSKEIKLVQTGEEAFNSGKKEEFLKNPSNWNDIYSLNTTTHPQLENLNNWYSSGKKVFPEDINMNRRIFKHWYVCDGYFNTTGRNFEIRIGASNEYGNKSKIWKLFDSSEIPCPDRWDTSKRFDGGKIVQISWNKNKAEKIFEIINEPLPGFEYKWPLEYR